MSDDKIGKGFLHGIDFSQFMDTYQEFHAFVHGVCEVLCPWPPRRKLFSKAGLKELQQEAHYYVFGRVVGVFALIGIAKLIKDVFF